MSIEIYHLSNEVNMFNVCANLNVLSINIGIVRFPMLINTLLVVTGSSKMYLQRNIAKTHVNVDKQMCY